MLRWAWVGAPKSAYSRVLLFSPSRLLSSDGHSRQSHKGTQRNIGLFSYFTLFTQTGHTKATPHSKLAASAFLQAQDRVSEQKGGGTKERPAKLRAEAYTHLMSSWKNQIPVRHESDQLDSHALRRPAFHKRLTSNVIIKQHMFVHSVKAKASRSIHRREAVDVLGQIPLNPRKTQLRLGQDKAAPTRTAHHEPRVRVACHEGGRNHETVFEALRVDVLDRAGEGFPRWSGGEGYWCGGELTIAGNLC